MQHTLDPCTGDCTACGARREQMDDNLVPVCDPIPPGPYRAALLQLKIGTKYYEGKLHMLRRNVKQCEEALPKIRRDIIAAEAAIVEISTAVSALKAGEEPKQSLLEAITKDALMTSRRCGW